MGPALNVHVYRDRQLVDEYVFPGVTTGILKIGRLSTADVRLDDPTASRVQAIIQLAGTYVSLIDVGSTFGTWVNGMPVHHVLLNAGDQILIGETVLVIGFGTLCLPETPSEFLIPPPPRCTDRRHS